LESKSPGLKLGVDKSRVEMSQSQCRNFSTLYFPIPSLNHRHFNPKVKVEKVMVEKIMVEKFMVENSGFEKSWVESCI